MIRSLEISHPYPTAFGSEGAEVLELLSALANLRIVRILASKPDWTRLQTERIRDGTLNLAGKVDITVHNTVYGDLLPSFSTSPAGMRESLRRQFFREHDIADKDTWQ